MNWPRKLWNSLNPAKSKRDLGGGSSVPNEEAQIHTFDPEARRIIQEVMEGKITPMEGASTLGRHWSPQEIYRESKDFVLQTRSDSLGEMDHAATELSNQGHSQEARRLAELNWILASRLADRELMVRCACTLAQFMTGDPAAVEKRLSLLEFAVPVVLSWDRATVVKAHMLAHLADAQFTKAESSAEARRANIAVCEQALSIGAPLQDLWMERLHYVAGTQYDNLADSPKDLEASIGHFRSALSYCSAEGSPAEYASVLNNLGNSLRDLGKRTARQELLQEAIACYDRALPFRSSVMLRMRTEGNEAAAEEVLRRLKEGSAESPRNLRDAGGGTETAEVVRLLHMGQEVMAQGAPDDQGQEARRRAAGSRYLQAASLLARTEVPEVRAELFHHLAGLFVMSSDDDDLWTGFCFATAAQRLSAGLWSPEGEARLRYHRGWMLMKIGYPDVVPYLSPAEELLRQAVPVLQESGLPGEFDSASKILLACSSLLAARGGAEAERRALALHVENETRRLRNREGDRKDGFQERYRAYMSAIQQAAPTEFRDALGRLALEAVKCSANQLYDEFNHAEQLIRLAEKHRDLGDLNGALTRIEAAEMYARKARYSAPSIWCDLAAFFSALPMMNDAARCLGRAQDLMPLVAGDTEAVLPGDPSGRWIAEYPVKEYQDEIDKAQAALHGTRIESTFDPAKSAALLADDESRRIQIEDGIRRLWSAP
jgi:tetratricopeptide (TPR) repeat protein